MNEKDRASGRRQILQMLGLAGLAAVNPPELEAWLQHVHVVASPQVGKKTQRHYRPLLDGARPKFYKDAEFKTLSALVEQIIPGTDTPGAVGAGAHWYLDAVVEAEPGLQPRFREGLALVNSISSERFGQPFAAAARDQQIAVLRSMLPEGSRGNAFFETVKAMTVVAYYSSEIGLYQELHWVENVVKSDFKSCSHGGHPLDVPARTPARAAARPLRSEWPFPTAGDLPGDDL